MKPISSAMAAEDRLAGVDADLGEHARLQELRRAEMPPPALRPRPAKLLKMIWARLLQLPMMIGEDADIERLPDQAREHVLVGAPAQKRPASVMSMAMSMEASERDIAAEQAEAGIDVLGEDVQEMVDDADIVHQRASSPGLMARWLGQDRGRMRSWRFGCSSSRARPSVEKKRLRFSAQAASQAGVVRRLEAERAAALQLGGERIGCCRSVRISRAIAARPQCRRSAATAATMAIASTRTAIARVRIFRSTTDASVEHLDGRRAGSRRRHEAPEMLAAPASWLRPARAAPGSGRVRCAAMMAVRSASCLVWTARSWLPACVACRRADGRLAGIDERAIWVACLGRCFDHAGADLQCILEAGERFLPALSRAVEELLVESGSHRPADSSA